MKKQPSKPLRLRAGSRYFTRNGLLTEKLVRSSPTIHGFRLYSYHARVLGDGMHLTHHWTFDGHWIESIEQPLDLVRRATPSEITAYLNEQ